jgi:integrase
MGEVIRRTKGGKFLGYYLRFYDRGRRRMLASKQPNHALARRMLLEIEARIARGEAGISERRPNFLTVAELIEKFLREYSRPKLKNTEQYRARAKTLLLRHTQPLLPLRLDKVLPADITRLRDALLRRLAPGTVKNIVAQLGTIFEWAQKQALCPRNPCRGIEQPRPARSLDFLSQKEVTALLIAAAQKTNMKGRMLHLGIALAVHTGLRKGELFGLRWSDLDLDTRRLTVARSYRTTPKNGQARHLRLPQFLVPLLQTWRERCPPSPDGTVLPLGAGDFKVGSRNAMLGLPRLLSDVGIRLLPHPWHLLRHTFASHFVMQGGNILSLQKILGHSDLKMTLVYAHLAPDFLLGEMDKVRF